MSSNHDRRVLLRNAAVALLITGCGSSPGTSPGPDGGMADSSSSSGVLATGFYDVTSSQRDDGCAGTEVAAAGAVMFQVYTDSVIGPGIEFIHSCSSTTHCPDDNDPFIAQNVVPDPSGGWTGAAFAGFMGASCTLIRFGGHITQHGTELRLELERDELVVTGGGTCDGATAQARASDLLCTQRRVVTGTPH